MLEKTLHIFALMMILQTCLEKDIFLLGKSKKRHRTIYWKSKLGTLEANESKKVFWCENERNPKKSIIDIWTRFTNDLTQQFEKYRVTLCRRFPRFHKVCDYICGFLSAMIGAHRSRRWPNSRVWLNDEIMAFGTRVCLALQGK